MVPRQRCGDLLLGEHHDHVAAALIEPLGRPAGLGLTIDTGHLECLGERPAARVIEPWIPRIVNVHVDDMLACRHDHLPLGSGDVDFTSLLATLAAGGYTGGLHVELPRQSHRWLETARESARFLMPLIAAGSRG